MRARPDTPPVAAGRMLREVIVLMCHEERDEVFALLEELGARPVDVASELTELVPRLQDRQDSRGPIQPCGASSSPGSANAVPPRTTPDAAIASR